MSAPLLAFNRLFSLGPKFNRLWAASAFSNLGDGLIRVALPLFVVELTDSPATVAGLTVAANAAWLTFGLLAGALNDRLDRRRVMLWASLWLEYRLEQRSPVSWARSPGISAMTSC